MFAIPETNNLDAAFGNIDFIPRMNDLPTKFQDYHNNKFCKIASKLFFNGGSLKGHQLQAKKGVDIGKAVNALQSVLASFEPKHEHKMAAVGFLISEWFEPFEMEHENSHMKRAN